MIIVKTQKEIAVLSRACEIAAAALKVAGRSVKAGISTKDIAFIALNVIKSRGAKPSFYRYNGFPGAVCISVNGDVIHGIPSNEILKNGDIVSIDVGALYNGYHGDNAATYMVGDVSETARHLVSVTRESLYKGITAACVGARIGDIGAAIQGFVEQNGFSVVRDYVGHGIGKALHEDPSIPNYGTQGRGARLVSGMTICIEPMINEKGADVKKHTDRFTIKTADGGLSAHFEHTVVVTGEGAKILTMDWEDG